MRLYRFRKHLICLLVKAKVRIFNSNLTSTIRKSGKSLNLNIGFIEITNPDTDDIRGLFTLWVPRFGIPVSLVIDENPRRYSLPELFDVLDSIQSNFDLFDIVSGDIDTDLVEIYFGGEIITLKCNSDSGQDYEYWTHKPYEKGLPYIISNFAIDIHMFELIGSGQTGPLSDLYNVKNIRSSGGPDYAST